MSNLFISVLYGLTIGAALSVDAFMLGLVYGCTFKRKIESLITCIIVGIFHCLMPLLGFFITTIVLSKIDLVTVLEGKVQYIASVILIFLGLLMINKKECNYQYNFYNLLSKIIFAFCVSIDSFLTGIAFTTVDHINIYIVSIIFTLVSSVLTYLALTIGKKTADKLLNLKLDFYAGILIIILAIITLFI